MRQLILLLFVLSVIIHLEAQELYFPPAFGNWETTEPAELDWCDENLDDLQSFLGERNSKAFIILKDGRIVVEWYYDTFTQDSVWYWASAGKSVMATMIGIAQEENLLDIENPTQNYLGAGWTSMTPEREAAILIRHQLSMATGINDLGVNVDCTTPDCLTYLAEPGTRWAYHNGPYTLLSSVIEAASGQSPTQFFNSRIGTKIGGAGAYIPLGDNNVFFSTPRTMARFGLMILANGQWNGTPILSGEAYLEAMHTPSQAINPSYGYLWWLNGQESYMYPRLQLSFSGTLIPTGPADMFAALGKNDQKLYVIPSENMVVIRMGDAANEEAFALTEFDRTLWEKIRNLACTTVNDEAVVSQSPELTISPNPVKNFLRIHTEEPIRTVSVFDLNGRLIHTSRSTLIDMQPFATGTYVLSVRFEDGRLSRQRFIRAK